MFKKAIITIFLVTGLASNAHALSYDFTFEGVSEGGVGSATMNIDITGNTLTLTLDNTSPTSLIESGGWNISAITGFGFNLENNVDELDFTWELTAHQANSENTMVTIGGNAQNDSTFWVQSNYNSITLDFLFRNNPDQPGQQDNSDLAYALYNEELFSDEFSSIIGNHTAFLTKAVLTMEFIDDTPILSDKRIGPGNSNNFN